MTTVGILVSVLVAEIVFAPFSPIMAWFGLIFLIATVPSSAMIAPWFSRTTARTSRLKSLSRFVCTGVVAMILTVIYAVVYSAPRSGTDSLVVVQIQIFQSLVVLGFALLIAAIWHGFAKSRMRLS